MERRYERYELKDPSVLENFEIEYVNGQLLAKRQGRCQRRHLHMS